MYPSSQCCFSSGHVLGHVSHCNTYVHPAQHIQSRHNGRSSNCRKCSPSPVRHQTHQSFRQTGNMNISHSQLRPIRQHSLSNQGHRQIMSHRVWQAQTPVYNVAYQSSRRQSPSIHHNKRSHSPTFSNSRYATHIRRHQCSASPIRRTVLHSCSQNFRKHNRSFYHSTCRHYKKSIKPKFMYSQRTDLYQRTNQVGRRAIQDVDFTRSGYLEKRPLPNQDYQQRNQQPIYTKDYQQNNKPSLGSSQYGNYARMQQTRANRFQGQGYQPIGRREGQRNYKDSYEQSSQFGKQISQSLIKKQQTQYRRQQARATPGLANPFKNYTGSVPYPIEGNQSSPFREKNRESSGQFDFGGLSGFNESERSHLGGRRPNLAGSGESGQPHSEGGLPNFAGSHLGGGMPNLASISGTGQGVGMPNQPGFIGSVQPYLGGGIPNLAGLGGSVQTYLGRGLPYHAGLGGSWQPYLGGGGISNQAGLGGSGQPYLGGGVQNLADLAGSLQHIPAQFGGLSSYGGLPNQIGGMQNQFGGYSNFQPVRDQSVNTFGGIVNQHFQKQFKSPAIVPMLPKERQPFSILTQYSVNDQFYSAAYKIDQQRQQKKDGLEESKNKQIGIIIDPPQDQSMNLNDEQKHKSQQNQLKMQNNELTNQQHQKLNLGNSKHSSQLDPKEVILQSSKSNQINNGQQIKHEQQVQSQFQILNQNQINSQEKKKNDKGTFNNYVENSGGDQQQQKTKEKLIHGIKISEKSNFKKNAAKYSSNLKQQMSRENSDINSKHLSVQFQDPNDMKKQRNKIYTKKSKREEGPERIKKSKENQYLLQIKALLLQKESGKGPKSFDQIAHVQQLKLTLSQKDGVISGLKKEAQTLNRLVTQLRSSNLQLEQLNTLRQNALRKIKDQNKKLKKQGKALENRLRQETNNKIDIEQYENIKQQLAILEETNKIQKERLDQQQIQKQQSPDISQIGSKKNIQFESKLQEMQMQIGQLRNKNKQFQLMLKEKQLEIQINSQKMQKQLAQRLAELKQINLELREVKRLNITIAHQHRVKEKQAQCLMRQKQREFLQLKQKQANNDNKLKQIEIQLSIKNQQIKRASEKAEIANQLNRITSVKPKDQIGNKIDCLQLENQLNRIKELLKNKQSQIKQQQQLQLKFMLQLKEKENNIRIANKMIQIQGNRAIQAKKQAQSTKNKLDEITQQFQQARIKVLTMQVQKQKQKSQIQSLKKQILQYKEIQMAIKNESDNNKQIGEEIQLKKNQIDQLNRQLLKDKKSKQELKNKLQYLSQQNQKLKNQKNDLKNFLAESQLSLIQFGKRMVNYQQIIKGKNRITQGFKLDLQLKSKSIQQLEKQNNILARQKKQLQCKNIQANQELNYLNRKLNDYQNNLKDKNMRIAQLSNLKQALQKQIDQLMSEKLKHQLEIGLLKAKQQYYSSKNKQMAKQLQKHLLKLKHLSVVQQQLSNLKSQLSAKNRIIQQLQDQIQPSQEISQQRIKSQSQTSELKQLLMQNIKCQQQIKRLNQLCASLKEELAGVSNQHDQIQYLKVTISQLRCSLRAMQQQNCQYCSSKEGYFQLTGQFEQTAQHMVYRAKIQIDDLRQILLDRQRKLISLSNVLQQRQIQIIELKTIIQSQKGKNQVVQLNTELVSLTEYLKQFQQNSENSKAKLIKILELIKSPMAGVPDLKQLQPDIIIDQLLRICCGSQFKLTEQSLVHSKIPVRIQNQYTIYKEAANCLDDNKITEQVNAQEVSVPQDNK